MAADLSLAEVRTRLQSPEPLGDDAFGLLRAIAHSVSVESIEADEESVELSIRLMERRSELEAYGEVVDALLRTVGLFPYLDPETLSGRDQLAFEAHRPIGMDDLVLHRVQAELYRRLLD